MLKNLLSFCLFPSWRHGLQTGPQKDAGIEAGKQMIQRLSGVKNK
jgi:hypothetical protein